MTIIINGSLTCFMLFSPNRHCHNFRIVWFTIHFSMHKSIFFAIVRRISIDITIKQICGVNPHPLRQNHDKCKLLSDRVNRFPIPLHNLCVSTREHRIRSEVIQIKTMNIQHRQELVLAITISFLYDVSLKYYQVSWSSSTWQAVERHDSSHIFSFRTS